MEETKEILKEIKQMVILNFAEIQYLKKKLYKKLDIQSGSVDSVENIDDCLKRLDEKKRKLTEYYSHLE